MSAAIGLRETGLRADERIGVVVALFIALSVSVQFIFPASHWFYVRKMDVLSGRVGQPIAVDYDRQIERQFDGLWRVKIWKIEGESLRPVCATPDKPETYKPRTKLPDPVTLEWLAYTDPDCYKLGPGDYEIEVMWTLNPGTFWERTVRRNDFFRVLA